MNELKKIESLAIAGHAFTSKKIKGLADRVADMESALSELPAAEVDLSPVLDRLAELEAMILSIELPQPKTDWTFEIIRDPDTYLIAEIRAH